MRVVRVLSWGLVLALLGSAGAVWVVATLAEGGAR
jgi:hypothetical protein